MDKSKIFKACNIISIVIGGLNVLGCLLIFLFSAFISKDMDQTTRGGVTFFTAFALILPVLAGVIAILAGKGGLESDPYRCRKCSLISLIIMALSLLSAFRDGSGVFINLVETAFYGFYTYLAHTEYY